MIGAKSHCGPALWGDDVPYLPAWSRSGINRSITPVLSASALLFGIVLYSLVNALIECLNAITGWWVAFLGSCIAMLSSAVKWVMLTGHELLARLKVLGDRPRSELVRGCGYASLSRNGRERLKFNAFYSALLDAKGLTFSTGSKSRSTRGRKLTYCTKVHFNGNLLVGGAYTSQLEVKPGDAFEIKLGKNQIRLVPVGAEAGDEND